MENQASRGVLRKRCSKNMHQIYRRTLMPKCDFNKVTGPLYQLFMSLEGYINAEVIVKLFISSSLNLTDLFNYLKFR